MRCLGMLILPLLLISTARGDELETIEGDRLTGTLEAVSSTGELTGTGIPQGINLDSLRSIVRDVKPSPAKSPFVLETHGDGRLLVDSIALGDDQFTVSLAGGKELALPLDAIRSVRFEPDLPLESFKHALANPSADQDKIFVKVEKQVDTVNGLILELSDKELTFEFEGQERKLPRERIHGIVLAQIAQSQKQSAVVHLINGSRLAAKVAGLSDGELALELAGGAKTSLPFDSVERIDLHSPLVAYLSDLEPSAVREETVLTLARPWQRDRSVSGKTLTLAGKTFARGIGVHAASELVFDVPEDFDTFVATVGIDAETQGRGDCEVRVLGDDRPLWSERVKGTDAPRKVRISLRGVKQLTLQVQPGADFDLGDHVDWCNARLLKQAK